MLTKRRRVEHWAGEDILPPRHPYNFAWTTRRVVQTNGAQISNVQLSGEGENTLITTCDFVGNRKTFKVDGELLYESKEKFVLVSRSLCAQSPSTTHTRGFFLHTKTDEGNNKYQPIHVRTEMGASLLTLDFNGNKHTLAHRGLISFFSFGWTDDDCAAIVTDSHDGTTCIWNPATGELVKRLMHNGPVAGHVVLSRRRIVSWEVGGTALYFWNLSDETLKRRICSMLLLARKFSTTSGFYLMSIDNLKIIFRYAGLL